MNKEDQTKKVEKYLVERELESRRYIKPAQYAWMCLFTDFITMPFRRVATIQQTCNYGNAIEMYRLGIAPDSLTKTPEVFKHVWGI